MFIFSTLAVFNKFFMPNFNFYKLKLSGIPAEVVRILLTSPIPVNAFFQKKSKFALTPMYDFWHLTQPP